MLRHAFETLGSVRVEFKTDVLNERFRKVLLRIGAKGGGGSSEAHGYTIGGIRDTVYYSIFDSEWSAVKFALKTKPEEGFQAGNQGLGSECRKPT